MFAPTAGADKLSDVLNSNVEKILKDASSPENAAERYVYL